jgi:hypothetical protein
MKLRKLMIIKNLRVQDVAELTGYGPRMVEKFMAEEKPTPKAFMDAIEIEPERSSNGMMRRAFIELLSELGISWETAASILKKHSDRVKKMADLEMDQDRRVAISKDDVRALREHSKAR